MKKTILISIFIIIVTAVFADLFTEGQTYTRQDVLRGSITPERAWWDVAHYHLDIRVDPRSRTISGKNTIQYRVLKSAQIMQVDLQPPMNISAVRQEETPLDFRRDGNAYFITLKKKQQVGDLNKIVVTYGGKPRESNRLPWRGCIAWKKDSRGKDFIATANQGDGASMWWPCKDHPKDEPEHMHISVNVPGHLTDVSNGRLKKVETLDDGTRTFHWYVSNPINHYGVNINIGDYVHFSEVYQGEKGPLDCDYWVLRENLEKAKVHFKQVPLMLEAFEHWFGPYPFYEDSYKLVDVPYTGMEHQSSVTYGNGYKNGYRGRDGSGTGWGKKFDFIIIHESGHEWFANSISNADIAYMWIHEAFIAYSENLFVDYHYGQKASAEYVRGTRANIRNARPMEGPVGVNQPGSGDMYSKGANMLHTLRQWIGDDEKWRSVLRGLNRDFYHRTVSGKQIENYIAKETGLDLTAFFDQYVRDIRIPVLEYRIHEKALSYRWSNTVKGFAMPVEVILDGERTTLTPATRWKKLELKIPVKQVIIDPDYYIASLNIMGN